MGKKMSTTYTDKIHEIAVNTFEITCYMFPLEEWELEDADSLEQPDGTSRSVVHFDGAAKGGMIIDASGNLVDAIAANMLGIDAASVEEKEGALCEIANIICGNTVPLFAKDDKICYIRPPRIAKKEEDLDAVFKDMQHEKLQVCLDEGVADISIYYDPEGAS
jgi:CheY-specific phosphatase CheX